MIPPRHYCIISNPVERDEKGTLVLEKSGQVKLRHGDEEIRFEQDPFVLYPGEKVFGKVSPLQVVAPNTALRLRALRDVKIEVAPVVATTEKEKAPVAKATSYRAGDEWLFRGPGTYYPRVEVQIQDVVRAIVIKPLQALRLRARKELVDSMKKSRKAGEEWLVRAVGAYLPEVNEEVVDTVSAVILTDKKALHIRAIQTFVDSKGVQRKAGEEWLVTQADSEAHIPDVYEKIVGEVKLTTLTSRQYCVVLDPLGANGKNQLGKRELRRGELSFFLAPGERLEPGSQGSESESGIQNVHVLDSEEALLLRAREAVKDERKPGDRWMIDGPCEYVPPVEVEIVEKRRAIPLDVTEGIYVRDIRSGKVRAVIGTSYRLLPYEELWEKELSPATEVLLQRGDSVVDEGSAPVAAVSKKSTRDRTRVVTFRTPHNAAVQVYDFKAKNSRVVFGPELVMLGPDEQFTVLSLSGDKPKRPHVIKAIALFLGPDFMTDIVVVETADHARLSLKLSYNWQFEITDKTDKAQCASLFNVPDFVGDACKAIASLVRGAVARETFDHFHTFSSTVIRNAVFGKDVEANRFVFNNNCLVITNIDIQSVEPVDPRTRDALQKSVQLAIEITTKSQEATARHEAERREQEARGRLERQKLKDEAEAEKAKKDLLMLQAQSAEVESIGQVTAEARARAEAARIEGEAAVKQAGLQAKAAKIAYESEMDHTTALQAAELEHQRQLDELDLHKAKSLATIESSKFKSVVQSIGADTIKSIAQAGPEMQAKLLQGLGLQGYMITDGSSPINLFNTANGLIGGAFAGQH